MNPKQKAFCEYYAACGNAAQAARQAGYSEKTARSIGQRLLTNADILEYIQSLQDQAAEARISSLTQVKGFWSDVMNDESQKMSNRLKASEMLAKSAGAFVVDVTISGSDGEDVVIYLPEIDTD